MNINAINSYNLNFESKHLQMSKPNPAIIRGAIYTTGGLVSSAYGAESMATQLAQIPDTESFNSMVGSISNNIVTSHNEVLTSAAENGLPAQSTAAPSASFTSGIFAMDAGAKNIREGKKYMS